jgi:hypothetical protein
MADEVMLRIDPRVTLFVETMGKDRLSIRCGSWTEPLIHQRGPDARGLKRDDFRLNRFGIPKSAGF